MFHQYSLKSTKISGVFALETLVYLLCEQKTKNSRGEKKKKKHDFSFCNSSTKEK